MKISPNIHHNVLQTRRYFKYNLLFKYKTYIFIKYLFYLHLTIFKSKDPLHTFFIYVQIFFLICSKNYFTCV